MQARAGEPVTISVGALGSEINGGKSSIRRRAKKKKARWSSRSAHRSRSSPASCCANHSANADIILERREKVLAIDEGAVKFDQGQPYVEVELEPNHFERRSVKLGLSDGLVVEVLSGLEKETRLKKQEPDAKPKPG